jgi:hypothetical protein
MTAPSLPAITHGICEDCHVKMLDSISRLKPAG